MNNSLYFGDNLDILKKLSDDYPQGYIDLIYIDPPFNSKRNYNVLFEDIDLKDTKAQKEAFKDTWSNVSYIDTLNEIKSIDLNLHDFIDNLDEIGISQGAVSYLTMMAIRIWYMRKLLKDTGSFYLHCDPTMSHYLKILCDLIFKGKNFRNEIVWHYRRWTNVSNRFKQMHDIILFYSKTKNNKYNRIEIEPTESQKSVIERGYNVNSVPSKDGKILQLLVYNKKKVDELIKKGKLDLDRYGIVVYRDTTMTEANDVWNIQYLHSQSIERQGYPTQKPMALMERIIKASSNEGDLVADFFCGCGTTIAAAQKLNRRWLGVDISHLAVKLITKRLIETYGVDTRQSFELFGFPQDIDSAKMLANETKAGRFKFEEWIVEFMLGGVLNDNKNQTGFDGYLTFNINGDKDVCYIEVKSGNATLPQLNHFIEIVNQREADMGVFVCFKKQVTDGMLKSAKQQGYYKEKLFSNTYDKIQILTIEDLLNHKHIKMPQSTVGTFKSAQKDSPQRTQEQLKLD